MADAETASQPGSTVLIANVTVHLASGESFELLPFADEQDVKSKVTDLLDDWAKSGYLMRGGRIYPWHQVKLIEAEVNELSKQASEQQILEWKAADLVKLQQDFWKTKQPRAKKGKDQDKKAEGGKQEDQENGAPHGS